MAQRGSQELIILLSGLAVAAMCFSGVIVGGGLTPVAHVSRQALERLPVRSRGSAPPTLTNRHCNWAIHAA